MNFKYLIIIPVLLFNSAFGQLTISAIDGDRVVSNTSLSTMLPTPPAAMAAKTARYDVVEDLLFTLYIEGQIGPIKGNLTSKGQSVTPSGTEENFEVGVRLPLHIRPYSRWLNTIAIGVGWQVVELNLTIDSIKTNTNINYLHIPVKYTSMYGSGGRVGFFWEAGVDLNFYMNNHGDKKLNSDLISKVFFNTSVSTGVFFNYNTHHKGDIHYMTAMLGPYLGYAVNSITANDLTYHPMVIGARLTINELF